LYQIEIVNQRLNDIKNDYRTKNERIYLFDSPPRWMRTKYKNQIEYVKSKGAINGAKKVLVMLDRI
jgi:trans-2-enoyl-CoA reductase